MFQSSFLQVKRLITIIQGKCNSSWYEMAALTGHVWQDHWLLNLGPWIYLFFSVLYQLCYETIFSVSLSYTVSALWYHNLLGYQNVAQERLANNLALHTFPHWEGKYTCHVLWKINMPRQTHGEDRNYIPLIPIYSVSLHDFDSKSGHYSLTISRPNDNCHYSWNIYVGLQM